MTDQRRGQDYPSDKERKKQVSKAGSFERRRPEGGSSTTASNRPAPPVSILSNVTTTKSVRFETDEERKAREKRENAAEEARAKASALQGLMNLPAKYRPQASDTRSGHSPSPQYCAPTVKTSSSSSDSRGRQSRGSILSPPSHKTMHPGNPNGKGRTPTPPPPSSRDTRASASNDSMSRDGTSGNRYGASNIAPARDPDYDNHPPRPETAKLIVLSRTSSSPGPARGRQISPEPRGRPPASSSRDRAHNRGRRAYSTDTAGSASRSRPPRARTPSSFEEEFGERRPALKEQGEFAYRQEDTRPTSGDRDISDLRRTHSCFRDFTPGPPHLESRIRDPSDPNRTRETHRGRSTSPHTRSDMGETLPVRLRLRPSQSLIGASLPREDNPMTTEGYARHVKPRSPSEDDYVETSDSAEPRPSHASHRRHHVHSRTAPSQGHIRRRKSPSHQVNGSASALSKLAGALFDFDKYESVMTSGPQRSHGSPGTHSKPRSPHDRVRRPRHPSSDIDTRRVRNPDRDQQMSEMKRARDRILALDAPKPRELLGPAQPSKTSPTQDTSSSSRDNKQSPASLAAEYLKGKPLRANSSMHASGPMRRLSDPPDTIMSGGRGPPNIYTMPRTSFSDVQPSRQPPTRHPDSHGPHSTSPVAQRRPPLAPLHESPHHRRSASSLDAPSKTPVGLPPSMMGARRRNSDEVPSSVVPQRQGSRESRSHLTDDGYPSRRPELRVNNRERSSVSPGGRRRQFERRSSDTYDFHSRDTDPTYHKRSDLVPSTDQALVHRPRQEDDFLVNNHRRTSGLMKSDDDGLTRRTDQILRPAPRHTKSEPVNPTAVSKSTEQEKADLVSKISFNTERRTFENGEVEVKTTRTVTTIETIKPDSSQSPESHEQRHPPQRGSDRIVVEENGHKPRQLNYFPSPPMHSSSSTTPDHSQSDSRSNGTSGSSSVGGISPTTMDSRGEADRRKRNKPPSSTQHRSSKHMTGVTNNAWVRRPTDRTGTRRPSKGSSPPIKSTTGGGQESMGKSVHIRISSRDPVSR